MKLLLIRSQSEMIINSFGVSAAFFSDFQEYIMASSKHDRWDGTDIVTLYPNVTSESAGGLVRRLVRTRIAWLRLTHNLVQKFKMRRETQTSTSASGGFKKAWCTYAHNSVSLTFSFYVTPSSTPLTEVCLCSWNSDREQTMWWNQNLKNWQRWWHRTCLPA